MTNASVADALAEAARAINSPRTVDETLNVIVHTAARSLDDIDHVGISLALKDGRIETMAGTDELVWDIDALQYDLGEGPCVYAITQEPFIKVNHLKHEQRWPLFVPKAAARGVRAQMAVRLFNDGDTLGGLNLYSTSSETIDDETAHAAELFATHAAIALGRVRELDQLNQAISSRKVIGQALGILMERHDLTEHRAFAFLARASSHSNVKLRIVAEKIVKEVETRNGTHRL